MNAPRRKKQTETRRGAKPKPQRGQTDWRDLAASVPQPSRPIKGKLPF